MTSTRDDAEYIARCPACGDVIDYCQGHGEIGDSYMAEILRMHDNGLHTECLRSVCGVTADQFTVDYDPEGMGGYVLRWQGKRVGTYYTEDIAQRTIDVLVEEHDALGFEPGTLEE